MEKPNRISSDFYQLLLRSGWYPERKVAKEDLSNDLETFPDEVTDFLREIWGLHVVRETISPLSGLGDAPSYFTSVFEFGEPSSQLWHDPEWENPLDQPLRMFGNQDQRQLLIDHSGRIFIIPDNGDVYFVGGQFYRGLYNLIYGFGARYIVYEDGEFWEEK